MISTIGDKEVDNLDEKVTSMDKRSYEKDFNVHEDIQLQDLTKEIFDRVVFLDLQDYYQGFCPYTSLANLNS